MNKKASTIKSVYNNIVIYKAYIAEYYVYCNRDRF